MEMREFGPDRVRLPLLGLGCSRLGSLGNTTTPREMRNTLALALDLGVTLFDTADIYGQGDSERELGRLIKANPGRAFVVTKVGYHFSLKMRLIRPLKPILKPLLARSTASRSAVVARRSGEMGSDFSPDHIRRGVDASLRRLGQTTLDGLLLHDPSPEIAGAPETADTLAALKRAGKVRYFGVSCTNLATLRAAIGIPGLTLTQVSLAVLNEAAAAGLTEAMRAKQIGVLVREVLTQQSNLTPGAAVAETAKRQDLTSMIVGTTKSAHLQELVRGLG